MLNERWILLIVILFILFEFCFVLFINAWTKVLLKSMLSNGIYKWSQCTCIMIDTCGTVIFVLCFTSSHLDIAILFLFYLLIQDWLVICDLALEYSQTTHNGITSMLVFSLLTVCMKFSCISSVLIYKPKNFLQYDLMCIHSNKYVNWVKVASGTPTSFQKQTCFCFCSEILFPNHNTLTFLTWWG